MATREDQDREMRDTVLRMNAELQKEQQEMKPYDLISYYQKWTRTTAVYPKEKALEYTLLGLAGEVGELCNKYKKVIRDNNGIISSETRDKLLDEFGDIMWYAVRFLDELGEDMHHVLNLNILKLNERKEKGTLHGSGDNR